MKLINHKKFHCIDCNKDTWNEYYMLYSKVWKKANPKNNGMLCIDCLESRLGRKLTKKDFTKAVVNTIETKRTATLRNRLGIK